VAKLVIDSMRNNRGKIKCDLNKSAFNMFFSKTSAISSERIFRFSKS
jgi:hypothetical protein